MPMPLDFDLGLGYCGWLQLRGAGLTGLLWKDATAQPRVQG